MLNKGTHVIFTLDKHTKTTKQSQSAPQITIHKYEVDNLDVVQCLEEHLTRTSPWRVSVEQDKLLLSTVAPHKPVATSTISSWLKNTSTCAEIDTPVYKGHSTRAAASSKAHTTGLSVAEILDRANWSKATTFYNHYNKRVTINEESKNFSDVVLNM